MRIKKIKSGELIPYVMMFAAIFALLYVQIVTHATIRGADNYFHWSRFYDIKMQLMTGKFSWFQSNFIFEQSGRIINALYGPFFAYLNAFLLLITRSWFQYELITNFLIDFIATVGMYKLALKIKTSKITAVILALIYINLGMLPEWIRGMSVNAWGCAFIPYLLIQVYNLLEDSEKPVHVLPLITCLSLIANTHLLSTIFSVMILFPIVIISFFKNKDKLNFILSWIKVAVGTLILTASVWGSLLVVYSKNSISTPVSFKMSGAVLELTGYETFRQYILPSMVILFGVQMLYALVNCKKQFNNLVVTSLGFLYLILASNLLLNWGWIQNRFAIVSRTLQFPFRLTTLAYPLLLMGLAYSFSLNKKEIKIGESTKEWNLAKVFLVFVLIQVSFSTYKFIVDACWGQNGQSSISTKTQKNYKASFVKMITESHGGIINQFPDWYPEYLPTNKIKISPEQALSSYNKSIMTHYEYKHIVNADGSMTLVWKSNKKSKVLLPIVMYQQSRLEVNGKKQPRIVKNEIGAPTVMQQKGKNTATLKFITPRWFYLLLGISIIGWIIIIGYWLRICYSNIYLEITK